jgi:hypothetical protein
MNRIEELINILAETEVRLRAESAKAKRICKICGNPAVSFRTYREEMEYNLSLMCQSCQDYYISE